MRRKGLTIFWPQYFDSTRPIRLGRRVPKELATPRPTVQDLFTAAQKAGYTVEIEPHAKYPATWFDDPGLILVDGMGQKKQFMLLKIAPELQKAKQRREEEAKQQSSKRKDPKRQAKMDSLKEKIRSHRGVGDEKH